MAKYTLGGRELEVRDFADETFAFVLDKLLPWQKRFAAAVASNDVEEKLLTALAGLDLYLGQNEGVTEAWLKANARQSTLLEVQKAAGHFIPDPPAGTPPGEAPRP